MSSFGRPQQPAPVLLPPGPGMLGGQSPGFAYQPSQGGPSSPYASGFAGRGIASQAISGPSVATPRLGTLHSRSSPPLHLFQKTLRDMITGMRQHKAAAEQQRFLHKCMAETREEARSARLPFHARSAQHLQSLRLALCSR
jgi:hypothetical protein